MTEWISRYWYVVTGLGGAATYFALVRYCNQNPDSSVALLLQRCSYAWTASIAFGITAGMFIMILSVFFPSLNRVVDIFFSPYGLAIFPAMLALAPYFQRNFPARQDDRKGRERAK